MFSYKIWHENLLDTICNFLCVTCFLILWCTVFRLSWLLYFHKTKKLWQYQTPCLCLSRHELLDLNGLIILSPSPATVLGLSRVCGLLSLGESSARTAVWQPPLLEFWTRSDSPGMWGGLHDTPLTGLQWCPQTFSRKDLVKKKKPLPLSFQLKNKNGRAEIKY